MTEKRSAVERLRDVTQVESILKDLGQSQRAETKDPQPPRG